ncbi:MAG: Cof-type HAD-IIB family hydrolase [Coriobacteriales bacterium]|jgi:hydroxymethylpyrimidine pyrophosphatase-like HAD family hydrolase|nr:Cof-type HAD-IIB family hydrolase [Coriobacteriales bacterium]
MQTDVQYTPSALPGVNSAAAAAAFANVTTIYTDLDGTLFAPGGRLLADHAGQPSTATAEALCALKAAGIEVVIVTGRDARGGNELLRILNLNSYIGEMGTFIQHGIGDDARTRFELGEWRDVVLADGLQPGELPAGVQPYEILRDSRVIERLLVAFAGKLQYYRPYNSSVSQALHGCVDTAAAEAELAKEHLPLQLLDNGIIRSNTSGLEDCPVVHIYHLLPRGCSKAAAVALDMCERGLRPEQALAIGDSVGDIAMGQSTGCLVAVANALRAESARHALETRVAQGLPTFITSLPTADGWVEFAEAFLAARS